MDLFIMLIRYICPYNCIFCQIDKIRMVMMYKAESNSDFSLYKCFHFTHKTFLLSFIFFNCIVLLTIEIMLDERS